MAKDETPKQVPPRNNLKKVEVYARSRANELSGKNPGTRYEWKSVDPKNPSYYGKFAAAHEVGNDAVGFAMAEPWEFVSSKEGVESGRPRDDQGKPIDTAMKHGDLVLMKTTADNYEVYAEIDRRMDALKAKSLRNGDNEQYADGKAGYKARVGVGFQGTHSDLLNQQTGA